MWKLYLIWIFEKTFNSVVSTNPLDPNQAIVLNKKIPLSRQFELMTCVVNSCGSAFVPQAIP